MADTILELRDIVKSFPGVLALQGINFNLRSGEIHAICGENGAGKSTLMKVVCGVYKPDSGSITVCGQAVSFSGPMDAYRQGVSIIFQETSLFEEMTVLDNLFLGHELIKKIGPLSVIDYAAMRHKAAEIFRRLHVTIDSDALIRTLGMAQKQMVEIAKALTFDARIILFDEPTASLTQREVEALFGIIRHLKMQGMGIVYISHRLEELFELCDRVTVVRDGQYISTRRTADTNKDELVAEMVGRKMGEYYPKTNTEIEGELLRVEHYCDGSFLTDICFNVRRGEILGFAGLAGAGRTELMESLCGFRGKSQGAVFLEGQKIHIHSYQDAMKHGIVYVSEDRGKYGLIVDMSIEQNITLPQLERFCNRLGLLDRKRIRQTGERFLSDVGIKAPGADFLTANLSGGNQQKVSVSKALALTPKLLILDEPTRGVDVNAKAEIHKIISRLTRDGLTILMVSSELPELLGMCDRIYVMKDGRIAGCFDRDTATQESILTLALESDRHADAV